MSSELPSFHFKSTLTFSNSHHALLMVLTASRGTAWSPESPWAQSGPQRHSAGENSRVSFSFAHSHAHSQFPKKKKKMIMYSNPKNVLFKKKKKSREPRTRAGALSLSVKLQPNYCLLRGAVKHNQSESLKDTISLFTNCLLVNSESPPCFKSTNHRAVMNSN